jgi:putative hydrolase of the HAD superfamily
MQSAQTSNERETQILAVVFDYGNVISLPQLQPNIEGMAALCKLPMPRFQELYWRFRPAYDRGDLTADSYWAAVLREEGRKLEDGAVPKLVALDCESWGLPNPAALQWVEQLRQAGIQTAVLSNMPLEISRYLEANRPWLSLFHHLMFSCDMRLVKPDSAIYHECFKTLNLAPQEILFLDDRMDNVQAATKLGIHSILFETLESALALIEERYDLPVPANAPATLSLGRE